MGVIVLVGMSAVASASPCTNTQVTVGLSCDAGGLTFSFTNLSFSNQPPSTGDTLKIVSSSLVNNDVTLTFQIDPGTSGFPVDILLGYTVTSPIANITGIDASYLGPNGSIFETATAPDGKTSTIVDSTSPGGLNNGVVFFGTPFGGGPYSSITISKDIDAIAFSEFTDSVQVSGVPEPMTLSMMGAGLLGLSLLSRRRKKS